MRAELKFLLAGPGALAPLASERVGLLSRFATFTSREGDDDTQGIFISYRRQDSQSAAGRLADSLREHLPEAAIFRDVETIEPGMDFVDAINAALESCDVLLAVIGPRWISIQDEAGQRRLDDPNDYTRLELATALGRADVRVIPVLVDGAVMPPMDSLPDDLKALSRRNALELTDKRWDYDVSQLVAALRHILGGAPRPGRVALAGRSPWRCCWWPWPAFCSGLGADRPNCRRRCRPRRGRPSSYAPPGNMRTVRSHTIGAIDRPWVSNGLSRLWRTRRHSMKSRLSRREQGMSSSKLAVVVSLAVCLAVTGCQSTGGGQTGDGSDPCNVAVGVIAGAALGALLGGKHRAEAAATGAGLGALTCLAVNTVSRQTKPADQVEADYRKRHAGKLPAGGPIVQAYDVKIKPDIRARTGDKMQVVSNMTVVRGTNRPVEEVKEVLTLTGQKGTKTAEKKANERPGSGAYENTFNLTFPKDVAPGTYLIKTRLVVNGNAAAERKQNLVIVAAGEARHFVLVSQ